MGICGRKPPRPDDFAPVLEQAAILVTGRRGPFPSFRVNGVYLMDVGHGRQSANGSDEGLKRGIQDSDEAITSPQLPTFSRIDRPEVRLVFTKRDPGASQLGWRCLLKGDEIARSNNSNKDEGAMVEVQEAHLGYEFTVDPHIVMILYPAPRKQRTLKPPLRWARPRCFRSAEWVLWEWRLLGELVPPEALLAGSACGIVKQARLPDLDPCKPSPNSVRLAREYELWGEHDTADILTDLLQGDLANCGVLAAIDSLVHRHPYKFLGRLLVSMQDGGGAVEARLFSPITRKQHFLRLGSGTVRPPSEDGRGPLSDGPVQPSIQVAVNTGIPRYARSLTTRSWGMMLELAVAEVAGGYHLLEYNDPLATWCCLMGGAPEALRIRRHSKNFDADTWQCQMPFGEYQALRGRRSGCCTAIQGWAPHHSAWERARQWVLADDPERSLTNAQVEQLLEVNIPREEAALVVHPIGTSLGTEVHGEACVFVEVRMTHPEISLESMARYKFVLGHAYSIREHSIVNTLLWVRLRDPRRSSLFWIPWETIMRAADNRLALFILHPPELDEDEEEQAKVAEEGRNDEAKDGDREEVDASWPEPLCK